jgi:hypothetical protein
MAVSLSSISHGRAKYTERRDQIRRKPLFAAKTPDGLAVLLEAVAASRGELAGDVDNYREQLC